MDSKTDITKDIFIKRSWTVLAFIFGGIYIIAFLAMVLLKTNLQLNFILSGIISGLAMAFFYWRYFNKPVIIIRPTGIWTRYLNETGWKEIKDIRIKKTRYNYKSMTTDTNLIIETTDGYKDEFDAFWLNTDIEWLHYTVNKYWQHYAK